ncbi:restriction endonuclease subunit S [Salegentibacter flavus]|uniref:Type I restriction enzyme, S subunit n=1 Tax=Salegentibacter flavus TaxID=287099 RepID=A0A1I5DF83_9FLAO|nr:restriction endonuclease subunit S [Salegentibacter flavus]SFN97919.1 type I restriction enzyme, S subunit [Salegentibacter flavus]
MPKNWKTYRLSEAFEIIGGGTPKTKVEEYWNGNIPWLSVVDFNNDQRTVFSTEKSITELGVKKSSTKILTKGQLIISARGTVGKIAQLGREMAFNQSCYGLSGKENILINDFGYYLLKSSITNIQANSHGSVFDTITRNTFDNIEACIPGIQEQKSIASILSALDDKIELNLQMNKTLEEMAMALYTHWFVDFGPFQDGEFVDSEWGEIPKGWEVKELKDLIHLNPRLSLKKGSEASFVEMKALPVDVMSVSDVAQKEFKGGAKFQNGDTLFARITPCLENGKTAFVDFLEPGEIAFGSTEFLVMRAKDGVSRYWTYCLARDTNFRNFAISTMVGTSGRQRVQNDPFLSYEIPQPPTEIFDSFSEIAEPWFTQIRINTIENQTLTKLRDTLLPKLISGEVRVKDVEKTLTEVL